MSASSLLQSDSEPSNEGHFPLETFEGDRQDSLSESVLTSDSSQDFSKTSSDEYVLLQKRLVIATVLTTFIAVMISAIFFGFNTSISLLVGALSGILYLRTLARSIGKLGISTKAVSKVQLLIPIILLVAASRMPQLEMIPALLGFLLYKPALIIQVLLER